MAKSTLKFKDSVAAFEQLKAQIAARKFAPIYLLMGEESYFIDILCDALSSSILSPAEQAFNQITVYGKDSDAGQIVNLCRQMPMMGSYEVIILKEAQQLRNIEKLSHYTSKPQASTILIICHFGGEFRYVGSGDADGQVGVAVAAAAGGAAVIDPLVLHIAAQSVDGLIQRFGNSIQVLRLRGHVHGDDPLAALRQDGAGFRFAG